MITHDERVEFVAVLLREIQDNAHSLLHRRKREDLIYDWLKHKIEPHFERNRENG